MPLALLAALADRRDWKDLVDACICADVASRFLEGKAQHVGVDPLTGEIDEIGLIYF